MAKEKKTKKPHLIRKSIGLVLALFLALVAVALNLVVLPMAGSVVDRLMSTTQMDLDDATREATHAEAREVAARIESEGAVLLQNDGTLPLSSDVTRMNVFGWASTDWLGGGSGSGGIGSVEIDLLGALEAAGIEYNTELSDMYEAFQDTREFPKALNSWPEQSARLYEPSIDDETYYSPELLANAEAFSDTAIVVIGRINGESNDATKEQYKAVAAASDGEDALTREIVVDESRDQLELSTEEIALLEYVGSTYENVIVLVNTGNAMELGPLETIEGIDAALLVGYTGEYSAEVIPQILFGEINPSGKTVDTFAYSLASAPSYVNSGKDGVGSYSNSAGLYPANGTANGNLGEDGVLYDSVKYVDYAEGIYVGYRWYETADAEGYWDGVTSDYGTGYDGVVQYPFGFGLSYTEFEWEVVSAPAKSIGADDTIEVEVKVTNTGSVAGKDVVELFFSAPYTAGGIEKSAVELGAFEKTKLLEPGESQTLTLTLAVRDMASYDCYDANGNGFAGYELENGTYAISLRSDAHTVVKSFDVKLADNVRYETDATTDAAVTNLFTGEDAIDGISVDGETDGQNIAYLSRADFEGTYPVAVPERAMSDAMIANNLPSENLVDGEGYAQTAASTVTTGADNGLTIEENGELTELGLALGADYDDPQWEALLDQLTQAEMEKALTDAYSGVNAIESVGKPLTKDLDGPAQFGGFMAQVLGQSAGLGFPNPVTIAQTWNPGLAREMGRMVGREGAQLGLTGWYGPAVNIHRSPLDGRNYEYYSEDPLISGVMCGSEVAGAKEAGVYCYVKHFICNDGESYIYRDSVYTWETEQTLREIYLEPFRILVEDYEGTGLMTSYNRIGAVWAGGSRALLTNLLRDEWGFDGVVITDCSDHAEYMNGNVMLRAGGDLWMQILSGSISDASGSADYLLALRTATKHVLHAYLNARVTNIDYAEATGESAVLRPTITGYSSVSGTIGTAFTVVSVALLALAIWRLVVGIRLKRAQREDVAA